MNYSASYERNWLERSIDWLEHNAPRFSDALFQLSAIIYGIVAVVTMSSGLFVVVGISFAVDFDRIVEGASVLNMSDDAAKLLAVFLISLLFVTKSIKANADFRKRDSIRYRFSLQLLKNRLKYISGGDDWTPEVAENKEPTFMLNVVLIATMAVIGWLGLHAYLHEIILQYSEGGVYYDSSLGWFDMLPVAIANADLDTMMTAISGIATTLVVLFGSTVMAYRLQYTALSELERITKARQARIEAAQAAEQAAAEANIYAVGELTSVISSAYVEMRDYENVDLINDLVNKETNNFFDSISNCWIHETGYASPGSLKKRVKVILEERGELQPT